MTELTELTGKHRYRAQLPGQSRWTEVDIDIKNGATAKEAMRAKLLTLGYNSEGIDMRYVGPVREASL